MMMNKKKPFSLHLDVDSFMPATAEEKEVISRMRPSSTFFRDGVKRLLKNKVATISLILIVLITLSSIIIPMFWPYSYDQMLGQTKGRPMDINEEILPADVLANMTPEEAEAARAEIRQAIGLLFDRNYIVEEIGQAGQVPASSFVPMGMTDADGSEFYKNAGHVEGITGYYDVTDDEDVYMANFDKAVETLKKYYTYDEENGVFTNFPSLTYLYNTSEAHKAIGEYLQSAVSAVGITMNLTNQEWNTFLNTRKSGDYSIARNGWIADYNDPICFLDMWVTGSGNNDVQFGKGANADLKIYNLDLTPYGYDVKVENGTWAETYDVLISAIKSCTDSANRYAMMHIAEDMLMDTGCIVPLYYYTDIYMLDDSVQGFFSNPLGYKYFMHCTIAK